MALPANIGDTTQAHLEQLVADQSQEGPHLDFKRELPANWDNSARNEFLADVSAFANAGGGDVVYGVAEDGEARASAVVPQVVNQDQEVRRLQDFLLNSVEPRIPAAQVQAVEVNVGGTAGHVIIIRVPQSWVGPHRVKTNQHFYLRDGLRKRQLDVPEIRGLFLRSESQSQRVRDFRTERISRILTGDAAPKLSRGPVLLLHLVPRDAAFGLMQVDPLQYVPSLRPGARVLPALDRSGGSTTVNLDGALLVGGSAYAPATGHSLLFRNGFFETSQVLTSIHAHDSERRSNLSYSGYEEGCIQLLRAFRSDLALLGVSAEMTAMLTLLHADKVRLSLPSSQYSSDNQGLFDRQHVVLPDVHLPADASAEVALKPVFDLMAQACGIAGSLNYDQDGNRAPVR